MKKFLGYGVFYLIGTIFILSLMLRVENLDKNVSKTGNSKKDIEVVYTSK